MTDKDKLSDMFPANTEIPMLAGKKAVIGPFTLEHGVWAEEKYGDMNEFQNQIQNTSTISDKIELLFNMLVNKDEFSDIADFRKHFPISNMPKLIDAMEKAITLSMPDETETENSEGDDSGKK